MRPPRATDAPGFEARALSSDPAHSRTSPDLLALVALAYLAIPNLIFFVGWLKPVFATLMLLLAALAFRSLFASGIARRIELPAGTLIVLALAAAFWSALGGAGHFVHANPDWIVRDKVLGDLTLGGWPPAYRMADGEDGILRSAFAYFFPAAVAGKVFGLRVIDTALYLWTAIGTFITFVLLPLHTRKAAVLLAALITVLFSGMDVLGIMLLTGSTPIFPIRMEWWVPFSYSSLSGQLFWAPNHALPLWIGTLLFYRHWAHPRFPQLVVLYVPLTMLWTPFVAMALVPFLLLAAIRWRRGGGAFAHTKIGLAAPAFALALTYLSVRLFSLDITGIPAAATIDVAPNADRFALKYILFVLMEFGIFALLLARQLRHSHGLFWLSVAILCILPLYQFGPSNDTMLRLSTPCLIILLVLLLDRLKAWTVWSRPTPQAVSGAGVLIAVVLLAGAATPFFEIARALTFRRVPADYSQNLFEQQGDKAPAHYIGRLDRSDLKEIFKTPALVPDSTQRSRAAGATATMSQPPRQLAPRREPQS